jgi:hypothetical protein
MICVKVVSDLNTVCLQRQANQFTQEMSKNRGWKQEPFQKSGQGNDKVTRAFVMRQRGKEEREKERRCEGRREMEREKT